MKYDEVVSTSVRVDALGLYRVFHDAIDVVRPALSEGGEGRLFDVQKARRGIRQLAAYVELFPSLGSALAEETVSELRTSLYGKMGDICDANLVLEYLERAQDRTWALNQKLHSSSELPKQLRTGLPEKLAHAVAEIRCRIEEKRGEAWRELSMRIQRPWYREAARAMETARRSVANPIASSLPRSVTIERFLAEWAKLEEQVSAAKDPEAIADDLHEVRKTVRRIRSAAEGLNDQWRGVRDAAERLQNILGEHQDAVVIRAALIKASLGKKWSESFMAGMLLGLGAAGPERARERWPGRWQELRTAWHQATAPLATMPMQLVRSP